MAEPAPGLSPVVLEIDLPAPGPARPIPVPTTSSSEVLAGGRYVFYGLWLGDNGVLMVQGIYLSVVAGSVRGAVYVRRVRGLGGCWRWVSRWPWLMRRGLWRPGARPSQGSPPGRLPSRPRSAEPRSSWGERCWALWWLTSPTGEPD